MMPLEPCPTSPGPACRIAFRNEKLAQAGFHVIENDRSDHVTYGSVTKYSIRSQKIAEHCFQRSRDRW